MKWSDIDWERQRIRIPSPKTAHVGKSFREIPLFPELQPYLQDAFELAAEGTEYIVTRYRDATQNLRTTMLKIIKRAGLEPWERVFHNLRASRQTELAKTYPARVVCSWMGNSEAVAGEHYLHTTESDFPKALENPGQNPGRAAAEMSESSGTVRPAGNPETQKPRHFRGIHSLSDTCTTNQLPGQGTNLCEISREIQAVDGQGDSQSDSLGGVVDPRLARLIEVWPALDDDVKAEIVRLARYDVDDVTLVVAR
ncbi:MAG: tyrosine-type recombinase/integrase [Planctomycetaceae bacterium]